MRPMAYARAAMVAVVCSASAAVMGLLPDPITSAWARPAEGDVAVTIGEAPVVTPSDDAALQGIATFRVTLSGAEHAAAGLRVFAASTQAAPVDDGLVLDDVVALDEETVVDVPIPIREPGDFSVRAIAFPVDPDTGEGVPDSASRSALLYVRITADNTVGTYSLLDYTHVTAGERAESQPGLGLREMHPGRPDQPVAPPDAPTESPDGLRLNPPRLNVAPAESSLRLPTEEEVPEAVREAAQTAIAQLRAEPPSPDAEPADAVEHEYITLYGTVKTTVNGQSTPLRYTEIMVYDHDPISPDDLLATTRTDNQGNYNVVVKNSDGPGGGGVDVYLYMYSQRSPVTLLYLVPDGEGGYTPFYYSWRSATHDNLDEATVEINYTVTTNPLAATIWAGASAAAWLTKSTTGRTLSGVEVRYPPFVKGTFYRNGIINIDPSHGDSPETVGHEYGHHVMYKAYGTMPKEAGGAHSLCETATKGLAWSEGFATWYGMAAWGRNGNFGWHIGGPTVDVERWYCGPHDASIDEGRAAAWMWDLYDVPQDGNAGNPDLGRDGYSDANQGKELIGSRDLINALWARKQDTLMQYWNDLRSRIDAAQSAPSDRISNYNYLTNP